MSPRRSGVAWLLLCVQVLPSLLRYVGLDTSMALGTSLAAIVLLTCFLVSEILDVRRTPGRRVDSLPLVFAAAVVFVAVPHAAIADNFQATDLPRLVKTLPVLFLLLAGGLGFSRLLLAADEAAVRRALMLSFVLLLLVVPFSIAGIQPLAVEGGYEKSMFPFTETSHWSLAFAPLLLYRCTVADGRARSAWLVLGFAIALGVQSLTLLVACAVMAMACRRFLLLAVLGTVAGIFVAPFALNYFLSRLDPSQASENISALVYIQGWQMLAEAFGRSYGWGVGFQQLGVQGTNAPAANAIFLASGLDSLNTLDGGFVLAKLCAEFGVLGIGICLAFVWVCVNSLRALRRGRERAALQFARCVVVCFTVDMFVRGTGYFTGSTLLAVAAVGAIAADPTGLPVRSGQRVPALPLQAQGRP